MLRPASGVFYRRASEVLCRHPFWGAFGVFLGMAVLGSLAPQQVLGKARVGIAGTLASSPDHPVTLEVALPPGYGLSESEREAGWSPLNKERRVEVVLQGSTFVTEIPPVLYCTHRLSWRPVPPPPAWFILRFSDAPDEEYAVWRLGRRAGVYVTTPDGVEVRSDMVSWSVEPGEFRFVGREGVETRWLLDIRLQPRRSGLAGERGRCRGHLAAAPRPETGGPAWEDG